MKLDPVICQIGGWHFPNPRRPRHQRFITLQNSARLAREFADWIREGKRLALSQSAVPSKLAVVFPQVKDAAMFNPSLRDPFLIVTLASVVLTGRLPAEESATKTRAIEIGRSVADTITILRDRRIAWSEGGFQVTRYNDDVADLVFTLDKGRLARIFYSKTTEKVIGISIKIYPAQGASKITQSDLEAKSIRFEDDGSYIVHFLPPSKGENRDPLPKAEFPSSRRR